LATGRGWVKNGDDWIVAQIRDDGSLEARRPGSNTTAVLPADYVSEHVELGYASTAHRAQGRTVDTAHAFVGAETSREPLYVMASRGRVSNRLYVDVAQSLEHDTGQATTDVPKPIDVLATAITTSLTREAATAVRRLFTGECGVSTTRRVVG
jgi:ATP-dependent exoDNAse (exonuclease V) alpha subunit